MHECLSVHSSSEPGSASEMTAVKPISAQRASLSLLLLLLSRSAYSTLLGWVESPGYPTGYLPHASLNWSRCAPKGHTLSIKLIHLDLEDSHDCENDAVKVFSNGNLIAVLCGKREFEELESSVNPLLHSTSGGCLTLTFHSDYSNIKRHTGFRGFYTDQDFDECEHDSPDNKCTQFCHNYIGGYHCSCRHGYYLDADKHTCTVSCTKDLSGLREGDISTPSWPSSYAENANCQYTLSVEDTLQLELHFSQDFDVEQSDGQCIDALRIETPSGTMGPFCGKTPPPSPLLTYSHHVRIHFTSDGYGTNKGFTLHFKTTEKVCQAVVTPHSTLTPQKPEYSPGETGTVTCELGYVANNQGTQTLISEYTTTCQITGVWTPTYVCEPVDCGFPDIPEDGILELVDSDDRHTLYKDQIHFNCSSKYYTLEGDDTYTCSASGEWVSDGGKKEMPKCIEVCGKPEKLSTSVGRIMGGKDAKMGQIPWQLLIKEPSRGGASLINDRWAVTAAHVVENVQDTALRLYGGLIDGRKAEQSPSVVMDSEKIIIHPGYIKGGEEPTNFDNDIALIRLASRVDLGPNLLPICLPEPNRGLVEDEQGTVSGWGTMGGTRVAAILKYAQVGVKSLTECRNTPFTRKTNKRMIFTNNMFCAGGESTDSCEKDSGGPFVTPMLAEGVDHYYLTGIVSWGAPCRERQYKGYYTKVENYVDWIKNTINTIETS